jgi:hypothetical protein
MQQGRAGRGNACHLQQAVELGARVAHGLRAAGDLIVRVHQRQQLGRQPRQLCEREAPFSYFSGSTATQPQSPPQIHARQIPLCMQLEGPQRQQLGRQARQFCAREAPFSYFSGSTAGQPQGPSQMRTYHSHAVLSRRAQ